MKHKTLTVLGAILLPLTFITLFLSEILQKIGLHPTYKKEVYDFHGKKALIITTSTSTLGENGAQTGVYASEMTVPYYEFLEAQMTVDLASIKGGLVPIEPNSLKYPLATEADKRFLRDDLFLAKAATSLCIDEVDVTAYDLIFISGGWGAAYDLGQSDVLGEKVTKANKEKLIIGSVCHGALGLIQAKDTDGRPLVLDKCVTGVTNKQIKELRITTTPLHPETELRRLGANYQYKTRLLDLLANFSVVDGNIVTGQNQNAGGEVAQTMLKLLENKEAGITKKLA